MYDNFLSLRLAKLRLSKGVSARDMSLSIGQNENYINHIENGKTMPSMQGFFYICDYFGITPKSFFAEDIEEPALIQQINQQLATMNEQALIAILEIAKQIHK